MKKSILAAALLASVFAANAEAATYVGTRTVGSATAQLSITTDDTIGVLKADNILDFTITMVNGAVSSTLFGPLSGDNAHVEIAGDGLTATATDLFFNFDLTGNYYALFIGELDIGRPSYCLQGNFCFDNDNGEEIINAGPNFSSFTRDARSGTQMIASVAGVPEPATWAMLISGFGLVGGAMRRRKATVAFA